MSVGHLTAAEYEVKIKGGKRALRPSFSNSPWSEETGQIIPADVV